VPDGCEETAQGAAGTLNGSCGGSFGGLPPHNDAGQQSQIWDVGLNYVNKFGDVGVGIYAGYLHGQLENPAAGADTAAAPTGQNKNQKVYGFGGTVDYAGFSVGGSYRHDNGACNECRISEWYVGLNYGTGPWTVGAEGGIKKAGQGTIAGVGVGGDDKLRELTVGGTYALGPGIKMYGGLQFFDTSDGTPGVVDTSGTVFILGTQLVF